MKIEILFPVINEELRLENGIIKTVHFFEEQRIDDYELLIVDNGSTDRTEIISNELCNKYDNVCYLKLKEKGVGIAFREGVKHSTSEIVGYMDIDLSTDISHLIEVMACFNNPEIDMVNASRLNKKSNTQGRTWYRNITSYGLTLSMKLLLGMKATDAICGFKFLRRPVLQELMQEATEDNGWFYIIELLIRAERKGYNIVELPVKWQDEHHTKVKVLALIINYLVNIFKLRKQLKSEKNNEIINI